MAAPGQMDGGQMMDGGQLDGGIGNGMTAATGRENAMQSSDTAHFQFYEDDGKAEQVQQALGIGDASLAGQYQTEIGGQMAGGEMMGDSPPAFDPETGQPLTNAARNSMVGEAMMDDNPAFDPETGERIGAQQEPAYGEGGGGGSEFDPETGERIGAQQEPAYGGGGGGGSEELTPVATSNVGKYYVGQQVNGMGGGEVNGYIVRVTPDEPGADGGPGVIEIGPHPPGTMMGGGASLDGMTSMPQDEGQMDGGQMGGGQMMDGGQMGAGGGGGGGGSEELTPVATSNVGKYYVGQQVNGMGGGEVNGYIVRVTPDEPGADGGPGVIEIGPHPPGTTMAAPGQMDGGQMSDSVGGGTISDLSSRAGAGAGASAGAELTEVQTSRVEKYLVGQQVSGAGGDGAVSGYIVEIRVGTPGATTGPGAIVISPNAPPESAVLQDLMEVETSNVGKYRVGQEVRGMGGGAVNGFIIQVVPRDPQAQGQGPGVLKIGPIEMLVSGTSTPKPPPSPPAGVTQVETSNIGKVHLPTPPLMLRPWIASAILPLPPPPLAHIPSPLSRIPCSPFSTSLPLFLFLQVRNRPASQWRRRCFCEWLHHQHHAQCPWRHHRSWSARNRPNEPGANEPGANEPGATGGDDCADE
jgi:hypothetical protein